jgi:hypothetical protein
VVLLPLNWMLILHWEFINIGEVLIDNCYFDEIDSGFFFFEKKIGIKLHNFLLLVRDDYKIK